MSTDTERSLWGRGSAPMPPLASKLGQLGGYVAQLRRLLALPREPEVGPIIGRALERMIQVLVDCGADAGKLWLTDHGAAAPDTPAAVFRELHEAGAISDDLADRFRRHVGVRERINGSDEELPPAGTRRDAEQLAEDTEELLRFLWPGDPPRGESRHLYQ